MPSSGAGVVLISWLVSIIFIFHVLSLRGQGFKATGRSKLKWFGVALGSCIPFLGIPAYLYFLIRVRPKVVQADSDYIQAKRQRRAQASEARAVEARARATTRQAQATASTAGEHKRNCPSCGGSGRKKTPAHCYTCGGSGVVGVRDGSGTMVYGPCSGYPHGTFVESACGSCGGSGKV